MKKRGSSPVNPELEEAVGTLLRESKDMELDSRLAIIDRALKLETLRMRHDDGQDGSAFNLPGEDD